VDLSSQNGTIVGGMRAREVYVRNPVRIVLGESFLELCGNAPVGMIELHSEPMRAIYRLVRRVAPSRLPVVIHGESGVGKEDIAQRLHLDSGRTGRHVTINAAVLSPKLAASELFGHVEGAFTGAIRGRDGAFIYANNGTLFIDEVAELSLEVQAELLRVVEQQRVRRLGDYNEMEIDVRLVCASHENLAEKVRSGEFREDLFHRIHVVEIEVPPLRASPQDVEHLARHFAAQSPKRITAEAIERLCAYQWPGNIRQLRNVLQRACLLADTPSLRAHHLQLPRRQTLGPFDKAIHPYILAAYRQLGQAADVAQTLGISKQLVKRHLRHAK
jgi:DNA-binding NtrC family response regulator